MKSEQLQLESPVEVYQLRVWLRGISPIIWRRLLIRSDSTIADLHHTLQIVMDWDDSHLHHFLLRGKRYGIARLGGFGFMDAAELVRLACFGFRQNEKFIYEYNYYANWQLEIRLEERLPLNPRQSYPVCVAGKRAAPPEDCGGPWRFMELKQRYSLLAIGERLLEILNDEQLERRRWDYADEVRSYLYWLEVNCFDRHRLNKRLSTWFYEAQEGIEP